MKNAAYWQKLAEQYKAERDDARKRIEEALLIGRKIGSGKAHVIYALEGDDE